MMYIFIIFIEMMVSLVCAYVESYQISRFKYVHFIICQLCLNKAVFKSLFKYIFAA